MNCIHLNFVSDKEGRKFLFPILPQDGLNEKTLNVVITDGDSQRIYPVFQQKAGIYGDYSEYMTRHNSIGGFCGKVCRFETKWNNF